jgi:hypothetical protein
MKNPAAMLATRATTNAWEAPAETATPRPTTADWRGFGVNADACDVAGRNDVNAKATTTITASHHRRQTTWARSRSAEDEEVPGRAIMRSDARVP